MLTDCGKWCQRSEKKHQVSEMLITTAKSTEVVALNYIQCKEYIMYLTDTNFLTRRYIQWRCPNVLSVSHGKVPHLHCLSGNVSHTTQVPQHWLRRLPYAITVFTDHPGSLSPPPTQGTFAFETRLQWDGQLFHYTPRTSRCPQFVTYCGAWCQVVTFVLTHIHNRLQLTDPHWSPNTYCQSTNNTLFTKELPSHVNTLSKQCCSC